MPSNSGHFVAGAPSPNPSGRPKGKRNPGTIMREALISYGGKSAGGGTEKVLIDTIIAQAVDGCLISQKLIIDRLIPSLKSVNHLVQLPKLPVDLSDKAEKIIALTTSGKIPVDIAKDLLSGIGVLLKANEQTTLADRLNLIEQELKTK